MSGGTAHGPIEEPDAAVSARRRRLGWGGGAWLFILAAIGVVQVVRGQWIDAAIFGVATAVLVADAVGLLPGVDARARPRIRSLLAAGAVVVVVLSIVPRHGVLAALVILAAGVTAVVIAWPSAEAGSRRTSWPRALRTLAISWAIIWIAGCVWELVEFILGTVTPGGRAQHPALSDLLDPIVTPGIGQAAFAVVWVAVGAFLVSRGGRR